MYEEVGFGELGTDNYPGSAAKALLQRLLERLEELGRGKVTMCDVAGTGKQRTAQNRIALASSGENSRPEKAAANERDEKSQTTFSSEVRRLS